MTWPPPTAKSFGPFGLDGGGSPLRLQASGGLPAGKTLIAETVSPSPINSVILTARFRAVPSEQESPTLCRRSAAAGGSAKTSAARVVGTRQKMVRRRNRFI